MSKKKILFHTKGRPSEKDLVLADGFNENGQPAMDICPVSAGSIHSRVVEDIRRWARLKDVRAALKQYQKYCCWNKYPENHPAKNQRHTWFLIAMTSKSPWRKDRLVFDTDTWDGEKFAMCGDKVKFYLPICPCPKIKEI